MLPFDLSNSNRKNRATPATDYEDAFAWFNRPVNPSTCLQSTCLHVAAGTLRCSTVPEPPPQSEAKHAW